MRSHPCGGSARLNHFLCFSYLPYLRIRRQISRHSSTPLMIFHMLMFFIRLIFYKIPTCRLVAHANSATAMHCTASQSPAP